MSLGSEKKIIRFRESVHFRFCLFGLVFVFVFRFVVVVLDIKIFVHTIDESIFVKIV